MSAWAVLALVGGVVLAPPSQNPNAWEKVKDGDGIVIYARAVPNSSIREVKAETVVDAPPERVWTVLGDISNYTKFMPYVIKAQRLGDVDGGHYEYQMIDPPLVSKRDYAVKVRFVVDKSTGVYQRHWQEALDQGPEEQDGVVRVRTNRGQWSLEPAGGGKTRVEYYLYTDPGGSIPAWITNKANKTSIPDLLNAVRNRSVDPNWTR